MTKHRFQARASFGYVVLEGRIAPGSLLDPGLSPASSPHRASDSAADQAVPADRLQLQAFGLFATPLLGQLVADEALSEIKVERESDPGHFTKDQAPQHLSRGLWSNVDQELTNAGKPGGDTALHRGSGGSGGDTALLFAGAGGATALRGGRPAIQFMHFGQSQMRMMC